MMNVVMDRADMNPLLDALNTRNARLHAPGIHSERAARQGGLGTEFHGVDVEFEHHLRGGQAPVSVERSGARPGAATDPMAIMISAGKNGSGMPSRARFVQPDGARSGGACSTMW